MIAALVVVASCAILIADHWPRKIWWIVPSRAVVDAMIIVNARKHQPEKRS